MPTYVERATADYLTGQQIVDQLGEWLGGMYQDAETQLLAEIARRTARDMTTDALTDRAATIIALREAAERIMAGLNSEELARRVVDTAIREGETAAIEQLGLARAAAGSTRPVMWQGGQIPFSTGITQSSALSAATLGLELTNALTDVNARILRAVPDIYQQAIARFVGPRLLGTETGRQLRTRALADWLAKGIPAFVDRAGRRWSPGAYVNMATRTATNRAWLDAHMNRWSGMGLELVTIIRGADSCQACAAWSGLILSTGGQTGTITAQHAISGEPITIEVRGTLASARAGGWNHPNCRCTLAPVFPGLSLPADESTYDPQAETDRERLRYLERRTRGFKQRAEIASGAGDDVAAAAFRRRAREEQARIREHIARTGQVRKPYREALGYSGNVPPRPSPAAIGR
jgi:hypothetical protein